MNPKYPQPVYRIIHNSLTSQAKSSAMNSSQSVPTSRPTITSAPSTRKVSSTTPIPHKATTMNPNTKTTDCQRSTNINPKTMVNPPPFSDMSDEEFSSYMQSIDGGYRDVFQELRDNEDSMGDEVDCDDDCELCNDCGDCSDFHNSGEVVDIGCNLSDAVLQGKECGNCDSCKFRDEGDDYGTYSNEDIEGTYMECSDDYIDDDVKCLYDLVKGMSGKEVHFADELARSVEEVLGSIEHNHWVLLQKHRRCVKELNKLNVPANGTVRYEDELEVLRKENNALKCENELFRGRNEELEGLKELVDGVQGTNRRLMDTNRRMNTDYAKALKEIKGLKEKLMECVDTPRHCACQGKIAPKFACFEPHGEVGTLQLWLWAPGTSTKGWVYCGYSVGMNDYKVIEEFARNRFTSMCRAIVRRDSIGYVVLEKFDSGIMITDVTDDCKHEMATEIDKDVLRRQYPEGSLGVAGKDTILPVVKHQYPELKTGSLGVDEKLSAIIGLEVKGIKVPELDMSKFPVATGNLWLWFSWHPGRDWEFTGWVSTSQELAMERVFDHFPGLALALVHDGEVHAVYPPKDTSTW